MNLKKRGYPQQKIRRHLLKQSKGQVEWMTGLFFLLFLMIILCAGIQMAVWRAVGVWLEDTLAASNLASAVIDLEEYGKSHKIILGDPNAAWERYCEAVRENLNLDADWEHSDKSIIAGPVTVVNYTIYNVDTEKRIVYVWQRGEDGQVSIWQEVLGNAYAPDGRLIETTGIYSELAFPVQGMFGTKSEAHKGKLIDIVGKPREGSSMELPPEDIR